MAFAVVGGKEFNQFLVRYNVLINARAKKAVATACFNVETGAKMDAPADTGRLRASIRPIYSEGGLTGDVGTNVKYAKFMEFGTSRMGKMFIRDKSMLPVTYQYGPTHNVGAKHLRRWAKRVLGNANLAYPVARLIRGQSRRPPGLHPRPFLIPNFVKERPKFLLAMRRVLKKSSGFRSG